MRFAWISALVILSASGCGSSSDEAKAPPRARQASKSTLTEFCATSTCAPITTTREEATTACRAPTSAMTRREGKCGPFDVLIEDSDLVTSSRYFDGAGKLVAVRVFSHEWGNRTDYGTIPECYLGALVDVCHYRADVIAPTTSTPTTSAPPPAP